jgi:flagellar biosynthesis protein FlhF
MRLRSFSGRTMTDAMAQVRRELGPDAVIVATRDDKDGGMEVTVAIDPADPFVPAPAAAFDAIDVLGDALAGHGLTPVQVEKILAASLTLEAAEPIVALAHSLEALYEFAPIATPDERRRVLMLVGPPGAGKTVTAAKLATRGVMAGRRIRLVTTDTARAGGIEQLAALADVLKVRVDTVDAPQRLTPLAAATAPGETLLIDTAGVNPYSAGDRRELATLVALSEAEPVLVLPGGADALDAVEMAQPFQDLGCTRFIATRLDMVRRLGSILAIADRLGLAFAEAGTGSAIATGLTPVTPVALARLLLPQPAEAPQRSVAKRGLP